MLTGEHLVVDPSQTRRYAAPVPGVRPLPHRDRPGVVRRPLAHRAAATRAPGAGPNSPAASRAEPHDPGLAAVLTSPGRHERKEHHLDCEPGRSPLTKLDQTSQSGSRAKRDPLNERAKQGGQRTGQTRTLAHSKRRRHGISGVNIKLLAATMPNAFGGSRFGSDPPPSMQLIRSMRAGFSSQPYFYFPT
jgi:hypothetical protein